MGNEHFKKVLGNSFSERMKNPGGVQTTLTKEKTPFATYCYLVPTLDSSKISQLTPPITRPSHLVAIQCDLNPLLLEEKVCQSMPVT